MIMINNIECVKVWCLKINFIKKLIILNFLLILFWVWYILGDKLVRVVRMIIVIDEKIFVWKYCVVSVLMSMLYEVCVLFVIFVFF